MYQKLGEECGIFGIFSRDGADVSRLTYFALYALQHRGQEGCGMSVNDLNTVVTKKDMGLVADVFDEKFLDETKGVMAIGHVRYSTTGGNSRENVQPLFTKYVKGYLSIVHNGNISNAAALRKQLEDNGAIFHSTSDTEVIAYLLAQQRLKSGSVEEAVKKVVPMLEGSFSLLIMSPKKLVCVRDPYGIRPLCMGKIGESVVFASESCALNSIGASFERDIKPGEMVIVTEDGIKTDEKYCGGKTALCIFEHIYFARQDSIIDGQSVYEARLEAGRLLAKQYPVDADMVIGVPDSGICAAIGYAQQSGICYGEGLVKNRYIGRTFIQPTQGQREQSVNIKLNPLENNVNGKRIVMIDDSIVRGTTIANIVNMLKKAGATEVHVRVSSPPFLWPCFYGTDVGTRGQLAAYQHSVEELREIIGADSLGYLKLESVCDIAKSSKLDFCTACFSGEYVYNHGNIKE